MNTSSNTLLSLFIFKHNLIKIRFTIFIEIGVKKNICTDDSITHLFYTSVIAHVSKMYKSFNGKKMCWTFLKQLHVYHYFHNEKTETLKAENNQLHMFQRSMLFTWMQGYRKHTNNLPVL